MPTNKLTAIYAAYMQHLAQVRSQFLQFRQSLHPSQVFTRSHLEKIDYFRIRSHERHDPAVPDLTSARALERHYSPQGDGEHPVYTRSVWRTAVLQEHTVQGYWAWVAHQLTADKEF